MKRFHVHLAVDDLQANIDFYSRLFGCPPARVEADYAKWMLDDPRLNFALSRRSSKKGLDHLGIQVDPDAELESIHLRLADARLPSEPQKRAACCYAESDKYWTVDPQGIPWEAFRTLSTIPVFGGDTEIPVRNESACCSPSFC
jgi:catechol 2,3-dioxygenase-like lactoylglutathione lyase family enzyme